MEERPFAAFDIDGTLIRWQLYHAMSDELVRRGDIDQSEFEKIRKARMDWKNRLHNQAYVEYEDQLVEFVDAQLSGLPEATLKEACTSVLQEYRKQTYTYTRDLLKDLKDKGYLLFAVSASPELLVDMVAEEYGFDDFAGSYYEIKDGVYTGHKEVVWRERKPIEVKRLVDKHHATWAGSIAVGDSESDIPLLSSVEHPIAMNPTKQLFKHAQENNWKVVVERKNMVYELRQQDGIYVLEAGVNHDSQA